MKQVLLVLLAPLVLVVKQVLLVLLAPLALVKEAPLVHKVLLV